VLNLHLGSFQQLSEKEFDEVRMLALDRLRSINPPSSGDLAVDAEVAIMQKEMIRRAEVFFSKLERALCHTRDGEGRDDDGLANRGTRRGH